MIYKDELLDFYNYFIEENTSNDATSVGWVDKNSQYKRFRALFGIGVTANDDILDLGCGLGHMIDFMNENDIFCKHYHGVDINSSNIGLAICRHPTYYFSVGDVFDIDDKYDYVLCSGTFTVMMSVEDIMASIKKCYEISRKGVAFNLLDSKYVTNEIINSFNPNDFFKFISSKYENCELISDYLPEEDFTIYIRK